MDGQNSVIINEVNKAERYVDAVKKLIEDPIYYQTLQAKVSISLKAFSQDNAFKKYIQYYRDVESVTKKEIYKKLGAFHVQNMELDTPEYVELFIDTGKGFHSGQSIKRKFNSKQGKMYFKLSEYANIQTLRFDPLNDLVKVKIKGISVFNKRGRCFFVTELHNNAMFIEGSTFLFGIKDSQITFDIHEDWGEIEKLIIDCEYLAKGREVYEEILKKCGIKMDAQNEAVKSKDQEIIQLRKSLEQREKSIQEVFCSRSWRVTKPLRLFMELFRGETKKVS